MDQLSQVVLYKMMKKEKNTECGSRKQSYLYSLCFSLSDFTHFLYKATQFVWPGLLLLKLENHLRSQVAWFANKLKGY